MLRQAISLVGFIFILDGFIVLGRAFVQLPVLAALQLFSYVAAIRGNYKSLFINWTEKAFGAVICLCTFLFASPLQLVLSGESERLMRSSLSTTKNAVVIIIANHQTYADWWYLYLFAWHYNKHADVKIVLKEELAKIPLVGGAMKDFGFIFLKRSWQADAKSITDGITNMFQTSSSPWLMLFPEGTFIDASSFDASTKFWKSIVDTESDPTPQHVLAPRPRGLLRCLDTLVSLPEDEQGQHKNVVLLDITMAYSGGGEPSANDSRSKTFPHQKYPILGSLIFGKGPREIHMHVNSIPLESIPIEFGKISPENSGDSDQVRTSRFAGWLRELWRQKEARMDQFSKFGTFAPDRQDTSQLQSESRVLVKPTTQDLFDLAVTAIGIVIGTSIAWQLLAMFY